MKKLTNRDKHRLAWRAVHNAIRKGTLIRPSKCENCGNEFPLKGREKLTAHHWKGYEEEFYLDIVWLCVDCHKEADRLLRDIKFGRVDNRELM